jgi:hypothetical protein
MMLSKRAIGSFVAMVLGAFAVACSGAAQSASPAFDEAQETALRSAGLDPQALLASAATGVYSEAQREEALTVLTPAQQATIRAAGQDPVAFYWHPSTCTPLNAAERAKRAAEPTPELCIPNPACQVFGYQGSHLNAQCC